MARRNIFVIGLDEWNLQKLRSVRNAEQYAFHSLLDYEDVIKPENYPFDQMLEKARRQLQKFQAGGSSIDGLIVHWDFPVTEMGAILCEEFGLRFPSLESVVKCGHKYWSRVEQHDVIREYIPRFQAVNPLSENALDIGLDYPFWIKPVKSFASHLGFQIRHAEDLNYAMPIIRENIRRLGDPYNEVLRHLDLPEDVRHVDGNWCVAEEIISAGKQIGIEGWIHDGEIGYHGVIDSIRIGTSSSFNRYQYPSTIPKHAQEKMFGLTEKLVKHMGLNHSAFNIEYFWHEETNEIAMLEINPRISQSHSDLFEKVDGVSNHQVPLDLALGRRPDMPKGEGEFKVAAKFMLRRFGPDARITRAPTPAEVQQIEDDYPGTHIFLAVEEGMHLSELRDQDSYSYELAVLLLGADSEAELERKYDLCVEALPFAFEEVSQAPPEERPAVVEAEQHGGTHP